MVDSSESQGGCKKYTDAQILALENLMIRKQWFGFARLFGFGVAWLAVCCEDVCPVLCLSIWSLDHMLQKAENVGSWGQVNPNEIEYE